MLSQIPKSLMCVINFPSSQFTFNSNTSTFPLPNFLFKFKLFNFSFSQSNSNSNANSIHSHYIPLSLTSHLPSLYKPPLFSPLPHIFTSLLLLKQSSISSTLNLSFLTFYTLFNTHLKPNPNLKNNGERAKKKKVYCQ